MPDYIKDENDKLIAKSWCPINEIEDAAEYTPTVVSPFHYEVL